MIINGKQHNVLIHIGYHKCASTWIQRELFLPHSPSFVHLGIDGKSSKPLANRFIYNDNSRILNAFDDNTRSIQREIANINRVLAGDQRVRVLSHERLTGNPHAGGGDAANIMRRLQKAFPQAKILIVIREQRSWLLSNYFQYLAVGGVNRIQTYLNQIYDGRISGFSPDHIAYHHLIHAYQQCFGEPNVLVLPYELLREHPHRFIQQIHGFALPSSPYYSDKYVMPDKNNVTHDYFSHSLFRVCNTVIFKNSLNSYSYLHNRYLGSVLFLIKKGLSRLTPNSLNQWVKHGAMEEIVSWMDRDGCSYAESNAITAKLTGIDLGHYGYRLIT